MQRITIFSLGFFSTALAIYILSLGQGILIPLVIAFVISYLTIAVAQGISKLHIPEFLVYPATLLAFIGAILALYFIVSNNVTALINQAPVYQVKLESLIERLYDVFKIEKAPDFSEFIPKMSLVSLVRTILGVLTDFAGYAGMVAIYVIFFLIEYTFFYDKLDALCNTESQQKRTHEIIRKINGQIRSYLKIKTFLSLLTSGLSFAVLSLVGVDFAGFWAILIFILNFIPTIGSIIATIFPCLLTLLQFNTFGPFFIVSVFLITIQMLIGNFIEPRIMGKSFNLSALFILLSLAFWGALWGVIGMFLCVPIMVIITIVLANFPHTRPIAIILSQDGQIE